MDRIQLRRDSSARWAEVNPILLEGEVGFETDTKLRKIGDGVHRWNDLEHLRAEGIVQETGDGEGVVMSQKAVSGKLAELESEVIGAVSGASVFNLLGEANKTNWFPCKVGKGATFTIENLSSSACSIQLYNADKEVIQTISSGLSQGQTISPIVSVDNVAFIGGYTYEEYHIKLFNFKSLDELNTENAIDEIKNTLPVLDNSILYGFFQNRDLTLKNNSLITPSGNVSVLESGAAAFYVSEPIEVTPFDKIEVQGTSQYKNCYYAIYDKDGNVLLKEQGQDSITTKSFTCIAPLNAATIRVSWLGGTPSSYIKVAKVIENGKIWNGIKWVCFGDSLTEKSNGTAEKRYYDFVSEELGITPLDYGKSGTGYFKVYGNSQNFLTRIEDLANIDFDVITFFGSFNDLDGGWIGGSTDSTDISSNNICGFINATLDRLYEIKPFVKVGIITPTPWYNSKTLNECTQYADALVEIARKRGIPCLDLFRCSNLHPDKQNFREEFYKENGVQDNGTHPNSKGHERIYPQFREFLRTML